VPKNSSNFSKGKSRYSLFLLLESGCEVHAMIACIQHSQMESKVPGSIYACGCYEYSNEILEVLKYYFSRELM